MNKNPMVELVKGSAFATGAALLTPFSVLFLQRDNMYAVAAIGALQLALIGIGVYFMWAAHKASRR